MSGNKYPSADGDAADDGGRIRNEMKRAAAMTTAWNQKKASLEILSSDPSLARTAGVAFIAQRAALNDFIG